MHVGFCSTSNTLTRLQYYNQGGQQGGYYPPPPPQAYGGQGYAPQQPYGGYAPQQPRKAVAAVLVAVRVAVAVLVSPVFALVAFVRIFSVSRRFARRISHMNISR
ncbi:hypothetical protein E3P89_00990 [Wallemia ichthyophaga]|uniref:Uncharacterized protein n=1 Tax=Wallemia ichthyophaga TaxID=245174 RepID=A0A4T0HI13_WALIC|nr:hypothetical protein E3P90_01285 [Wallemia ichthyophaga]TIB16211.1 hypothetical protein E3P93_01036 [Wallemia ichthyophaga]TIB24469.1 hypothetical protein E3P89_00990 [Wallemia ichthyophaga]TIB26146.1 hypothetical protein E3P88_01154 [Wallemia ichthyophaga]